MNRINQDAFSDQAVNVDLRLAGDKHVDAATTRKSEFPNFLPRPATAMFGDITGFERRVQDPATISAHPSNGQGFGRILFFGGGHGESRRSSSAASTFA